MPVDPLNNNQTEQKPVTNPLISLAVERRTPMEIVLNGVEGVKRFLWDIKSDIIMTSFDCQDNLNEEILITISDVWEGGNADFRFCFRYIDYFFDKKVVHG